MIETERLILRPFVESDAADVLEYLASPAVHCFYSMRISSLEAAKAVMKKRAEDEFYLAIVLKENGKVIGEIFGHPEGTDPEDKTMDTFSPCWMLNLEYGGKGYAYEAAHDADLIADEAEILFLSLFRASAGNFRSKHWWENDDDILDEIEDKAEEAEQPDEPQPAAPVKIRGLWGNVAEEQGRQVAEEERLITPAEPDNSKELLERAKREIKNLKSTLAMVSREADSDRAKYEHELKALRMKADLEKRRDAEIERREYLERRQEVLRPLVAVLNKPELTRDILMAVVDRIYWYDGALEVLVKGEEYLGGEGAESLINID